MSAAMTSTANPALAAAYNYAYRFDRVGNKLHEDRGQLDIDGSHNNLNQLLTNEFSGKIDVVGAVNSTSLTVKVMGQQATVYGNSNYWGGAKIGIGTKQGTYTLSVVATNVSGNQSNLVQTAELPPENPQRLLWDGNGNLTNDTIRAYAWTEENRLASVTKLNPQTGDKKGEYLYDGMGRRIQKVISTWTSGAWQVTSTNRYTWDGWLLLSEISYAGSQVSTNEYVWGLDLSQSLQGEGPALHRAAGSGAGGIGGLLCVIRNGTPYFPCFDGNGNVSDYVDLTGAVVAHREYDPFGNTVRSTGAMKDAFSFWFSTKYLDQESGLYYYGLRYYSCAYSRWISREMHGTCASNAYLAFVNRPCGLVDPDGRDNFNPDSTSEQVGVIQNETARATSESPAASRVVPAAPPATPSEPEPKTEPAQKPEDVWAYSWRNDGNKLNGCICTCFADLVRTRGSESESKAAAGNRWINGIDIPSNLGGATDEEACANWCNNAWNGSGWKYPPQDEPLPDPEASWNAK